MRTRTVSVDNAVEFWRTLSNEEKLAFADNHALAKRMLQRLAKKVASSSYVTAISDMEAIQWLVRIKMYDAHKATIIVDKWRAYAANFGYTGPIAWKVRAGFTLKSHAPLAGPCYENLKYLQGWDLHNDQPTKDSLVFWVPRLAPNSTYKSISEMKTRRDALKDRFKLPAHHAVNFGSIALHFALILAHFKRTGERVPLGFCYAASDTLRKDSCRLISGGFDDAGRLRCDRSVSEAFDGIGFFLLGVEEVLGE